MFKFNNKETFWTYFTPCSGVFIVNFEQVNADWDSYKKKDSRENRGRFVFIAPLNRDGIKSKGDILFEDEFDAVMTVVYSDVLKHDKEIPS